MLWRLARQEVSHLCDYDCNYCTTVARILLDVVVCHGSFSTHAAVPGGVVRV